MGRIAHRATHSRAKIRGPIAGGRLAQAGVAIALAAAVALGAALPALAGSKPKTGLVSKASGGAQGNGASYDPSTSADGRFVAFDSSASNLVGGDANGTTDVFVRDRGSGKTRRVSLSSAGAEGNGASFNPSISADGRFVAFSSDASNLAGGDTNGTTDVFVHDRGSGKTRRVSLSSAGAEGNGASFSPSISADGRFVAFSSNASNLAGGDTNGDRDVFVHDRGSGKTRRVSLSSAGAEGNLPSDDASISANGRFVAFDSYASTLVGGDTNGTYDVFVRDRGSGKTRRVSLSSAGAEGNGESHHASISADGRFVAFESDASTLVGSDTNGTTDVFVRDRRGGKTRRVSLSSAATEGNGASYEAAISASGRFVAFSSSASNLVGFDTNDYDDVFVRDRGSGKTRRVSLSSAATEGNDYSYESSISADGRFVAFYSYASNLVGGDTNNATDVFVRGPGR